MAELYGQIAFEKNGSILEADGPASLTGRIDIIRSILKSQGIDTLPITGSFDDESETVKYSLEPPARQEVIDEVREYCEGSWHDDGPGALYPPIVKNLNEAAVAKD